LQEPYFLAADYALRPTGLHSDAPSCAIFRVLATGQGQGLTEPARLVHKAKRSAISARWMPPATVVMAP
jgi:hypothetical protein